MPVIVDSEAAVVLNSPAKGVAWLVELEFSGAPLYVTTWSVALTWNTKRYIALGGLAGVDNLSESENLTNTKLGFSLPIVDKAMIAKAMGSPETYRGRRARLYLQAFDETYRPRGEPTLRWQGTMDKVKIDRKTYELAKGVQASGKITLEASRRGMNRSRRFDGDRLTYEQRKVLYPNDKGLSGLINLVEKPALWLSKDFQKV